MEEQTDTDDRAVTEGARGVFVPYRYAETLTPRGYSELGGLFAATKPAALQIIAAMEEVPEFVARFSSTTPPHPRWEQDWFPGLDGAAAYAIVRSRAPKRILEIGSGHSTRFMARAVKDAGLGTQITCVDPQPRADIAALDVTLIREPVQAVPADALPTLEAGDVLFIDSSHLALAGGDVDHLFGRILPTLPAGVLLHIHDVFLPDAYPESWAWRAYSEQIVVAGWLASGGLEPIFASHYLRHHASDWLTDTVAAEIPLPDGAIESSLWSVKRAPALVTA